MPVDASRRRRHNWDTAMEQLSSATIWSQLSADLRRFIRRRVPDDHIAEDLLQDTFIRIHRSLPTLRNEERLAAWVHQIARNAVRDYYRRTAPNEPLPEVEDSASSEEPLNAIRSQLERWMPELIAQLPKMYREAITLAEIDGLTQQEVANRLGLSLSGAKSRVQRGRLLLREVLDQCCAFHFDHAGRLTDCDPLPNRTVCRDCETLD